MSAYDAPPGGAARSWSLAACYAYLCACYVAGAGAGAGVAHLVFANMESVRTASVQGVPAYPLVLAGVADLVATLVVWVSAIPVNNSSMYDPYWSVFPPVAVLYWVGTASLALAGEVPTARSVLVVVSTWIWAIRLTRNWALGWMHGLAHEDFRYGNIRDSFRALGAPKWVYWLGGSLGAIMLVPTILVFAGCIPAFMALTAGRASAGANAFNALDVVATCVCAGGALLQLVADRQMREFRRRGLPASVCMHEGLWRYSRHPNYFGELTFWFGMYLHALAAKTAFWWSGIGFLLMTGLFVFASVPLMEKRMLKRRPEYRRVMQTTSRLVPFFPFPAPEERTGVAPVS